MNHHDERGRPRLEWAPLVLRELVRVIPNPEDLHQLLSHSTSAFAWSKVITDFFAQKV